VAVAIAPFKVSTEQVGEHAVVAVTGEVDAHTADQVRAAVEGSIAPGIRLVVDLSDVTFLDSTGLGVFVTAVKHLREQDGSLDLVITSPRVMKVFELTGLDVVIPIHEDRAAALAS
jgi:anti-sigma B factor antagonist